MEPDQRIKVGGLKVLGGGTCLVSSFPGAEFRLGAQVTGPLAHNKINLTFLTHVAGDRTALCTSGEAGEGALALLQHLGGSKDAFKLQRDIAIVGVYPHDKRPEIIGAFIRSLARSMSRIFGLASSPSAITGILETRRKVKAVHQLFADFQFSSFADPREFFAAQEFPEEYVRKAVATYQEKVIKVYWVLSQPDLDLWAVSIPTAAILEEIADILTRLGSLGLAIPFLIAIPRLGTEELLFAFSTARAPGAPDQGGELRRLLHERLPGIRPMRLTPVAGIFLHGPHFGDRYGITHALVEALEQVNVSILAMSCTISSISLIVRQHELAPALMVLGQVFQAPVSGTPSAI